MMVWTLRECLACCLAEQRGRDIPQNYQHSGVALGCLFFGRTRMGTELLWHMRFNVMNERIAWEF
jgi:hypothetical protein